MTIKYDAAKIAEIKELYKPLLQDGSQLVTILFNYIDELEKKVDGLKITDTKEINHTEILALLKDIEWGGSCMSYGYHCPSCSASESYGGANETHNDDCKLKKIIDEMEGK